MDVSSLSQAPSTGASSAAQPDITQARTAFEASRKLNSLEITGREFSVIRDPASNRFVVVVRDDETGTVLDQFPPEDILKMLAQLTPFKAADTGNTGNTGDTQA